MYRHDFHAFPCARADNNPALFPEQIHRGRPRQAEYLPQLSHREVLRPHLWPRPSHNPCARSPCPSPPLFLSLLPSSLLPRLTSPPDISSCLIYLFSPLSP